MITKTIHNEKEIHSIPDVIGNDIWFVLERRCPGFCKGAPGGSTSTGACRASNATTCVDRRQLGGKRQELCLARRLLGGSQTWPSLGKRLLATHPSRLCLGSGQMGANEREVLNARANLPESGSCCSCHCVASGQLDKVYN